MPSTTLVAAGFRAISAQPDATTVAATWDEVREHLVGRFPKIGKLRDAAKARALAFSASPDRTGQRSGAPTRSSE